jgi:AcrR family transcriptional regulator
MASLELTKERLLEAAGEEFAERGLVGARVRAICERAGANVAAVNYHFGGKEQLYVATVLEAHRRAVRQPPEVAVTPGTPADELRQFIYFFLSNVVQMNRRKNEWPQVLILREMFAPTAALEAVVQEAIRPRFERLEQILRRAVPEADELRLGALACSVVGQCLHYKFAAEVTERLLGPEAYAALDVDYLSDHISNFCLAALGLAPPLDAAGRGCNEREFEEDVCPGSR